MATSLEHMTAEEIGEWLKSHGFSEDIVANFQGKNNFNRRTVRCKLKAYNYT